eukprot:786132-Rhodomonas_salina.1
MQARRAGTTLPLARTNLPTFLVHIDPEFIRNAAARARRAEEARGAPENAAQGRLDPICLRACYAMSGTGIAHAGYPLRTFRYWHSACWVSPTHCPRMSGSDRAYGATRKRKSGRRKRKRSYALDYSAMQCPVLSCAMLLCDIRSEICDTELCNVQYRAIYYIPLCKNWDEAMLSCYATCGAILGYDTMH